MLVAPLRALYVGGCTFPSLGTGLQIIRSSPYHTGLAQQHHKRLHSAPRFPAMLLSPRAFASRYGRWPRGPPSEPLPSVRVIQRRVRRRNFALHPALPDSSGGSSRPRLLRGLRPIPGIRSATNLPCRLPAGRQTRWPRMVPTFTQQSIGQGGAQLYSGSIATPTPQTFGVASPPLELV